MMKQVFKLAFVCMALYLQPPTSAAQESGTTRYKCMIQMTNYVGEGAYIVVSLINSKGVYEKTLRVMGSDKKWYKNLKSWHQFQSKKPASDIDGITGASVTGGDRSVTVLEIENSKINAGYKLRFESAVEDKKYNEKDLEIPLTTEGLAAKSEGTGYIRYVRLAQN
jgi:hypothetical protein